MDSIQIFTSIASSKSFWSISPLWLTSGSKMKPVTAYYCSCLHLIQYVDMQKDYIRKSFICTDLLNLQRQNLSKHKSSLSTDLIKQGQELTSLPHRRTHRRPMQGLVSTNHLRLDLSLFPAPTKWEQRRQSPIEIEEQIGMLICFTSVDFPFVQL